MWEYNALNTIFYPFLLAFLITTFVTPACISILKKFNILDDPRLRNHPGIIHKKPVPRGGGIPLLIGIIISGILLLPPSPITIVIFLASILALVIGTIDDIYNANARDLHPYIRFLFNIISAIIVVSAGISIDFITNPLGGIIHFDTMKLPLLLPFISLSVAHLITVVWIVWVMNMLNWSKGVDGQMPGIVAISAFIIGLLSLRYYPTDPSVIIAAKLSFIIAGSAVGFLLFNFYPARIFPGYGATSVYLLLAVVSILSGAKLATALLVMGVPVIDGIFTIIRRLLSGRSPFLNDNKHLHHLLLKLGFGQRRIAISYWVFSGFLGGLALILDSRSKIFAFLMLIVVVTGSLLFLHFIVRYTHEKAS